MIDKICEYRDIILLTIGTLLVILSICLVSYDKVELLRSNVFNEISMEQDRERMKENENHVETVTDADTDIIDEEDLTNETPKEPTSSDKEKIRKEYIGYLEIKKVNLKQGLVSKNSYYNKVNYNIQMLKTSDYPDKDRGNTILAAHSGSGYLSFFKHLYKLSLGDEATIYYKGYVYTYKIVSIYNVQKNGKVRVNRDINKTCLTLITCTYKSKTEQTVYILELTSKVKDGDSQ